MAIVNVVVDVTEPSNAQWYYGGREVVRIGNGTGGTLPLICISGSDVVEFRLFGYELSLSGIPQLVSNFEWTGLFYQRPLGWSAAYISPDGQRMSVTYAQQGGALGIAQWSVILSAQYGDRRIDSQDPQILNDNP